MNFSILLPTLATLVLLSTTARAEDWPMYRGPQLDGSTSEKITTTKWNEGGLVEVWRVPTPAGFSSFSTGGGMVYTLVGREDSDGVFREVAVALDAATGKEVWANPMCIGDYDGGGDSGADGNDGGDGPRSTPSFSNGKVYVFDSLLNLYCFEANSGKTLWHKDILKEFEGRNIRWQGAASPVLEAEMVLVPGGGEGQSFLAFNKESGDVIWKSGDETMTHVMPVPATIHGVRQIIFFCQSGLVSVDAKSGKELWKQEYDYKISTAASPIVSGDLVYCSAGYGVGAGLYRIVKDGDGFKSEEVWRKRKELMNHWSTPVLKDGHLYGMFSFKQYGDGPMKAVNLVEGEEKWEQEGFGPGNCILAGGQLLALSDDGHLVLVDPDPSSYKEVVRTKVVDGKCWSTPTLANGHVFVRSTKEAACYRLVP